jgi:transposase
VHCSKTAVAELMRVAWRTVGAILERVAGEAGREVDLLDGLRRIEIDEISHRRGRLYLTVVVDHDTGRLVWAAPGRDRKTVEAFLDELGEERCKLVELVSCDMAWWIAAPLAERLPAAMRSHAPAHYAARRAAPRPSAPASPHRATASDRASADSSPSPADRCCP